MAAGVGITACSDLERGHAAEMTVHAVRAIAGAVSLPIGWDVGWQRHEVDRLLDQDHAALAIVVARRLRAWGWHVKPEVSFSRYGERGRIDVLAFHPVAAALLVVELKTMIVDGQELLGGLDVKARVAPFVAREVGWEARVVVSALIVTDGTTNRRRVRQIEPLLQHLSLRGHAALGWLREPIGTPTGILLLTKLPDSAGSDVRRAGRRLVRQRVSRPRSG